MNRIDNKWFFRSPHPALRLLGIYINGDIICLAPILIVVIALSFFTTKFAMLLYFIYYALRSLGEMIYWLLQQFGPRTYRPADFGMNQLDNHAIYIVYQTSALAQTVIAVFCIFLSLS